MLIRGLLTYPQVEALPADQHPVLTAVDVLTPFLMLQHSNNRPHDMLTPQNPP